MGMASSIDVAKKWADRMRGASEAYKAGIQNTTVNPMEEAAKNVEGYRNGVMEAIDSGKYAAGLRRVSKDEWQRKAMELGASRLASGAAAAQGKMQQFLDGFLPFLASNVAQVKSMSKATLQDRIARATKMMELNAQYKRTR